jgi:signal transduction histidine kinase
MAPLYLVIIGYVIGFIGEQRARFESRVHELESAAQRHSIARSLHDGYVQALAGVNLRIESCRTLISTGRSEQAFEELQELQGEVRDEFDSIRAYIRTLADVEKVPTKALPLVADTRVNVSARFSCPLLDVEQIMQIALEGIRNAWRHGRASLADVEISQANGTIKIAIDDDGSGFGQGDPLPWTIASRVAETRGRLTVGRNGSAGAHVEIELPVS